MPFIKPTKVNIYQTHKSQYSTAAKSTRHCRGIVSNPPGQIEGTVFNASLAFCLLLNGEPFPKYIFIFPPENIIFIFPPENIDPKVYSGILGPLHGLCLLLLSTARIDQEFGCKSRIVIYLGECAKIPKSILFPIRRGPEKMIAKKILEG